MSNAEKTRPKTQPELKLVGEDGNAFSILGRAQRAAKHARWTPTQIKAFMDEAMRGDYNHLLGVTMEWFNCDPPGDDEDYEEDGLRCASCGGLLDEWSSLCGFCDYDDGDYYEEEDDEQQ